MIIVSGYTEGGRQAFQLRATDRMGRLLAVCGMMCALFLAALPAYCNVTLPAPITPQQDLTEVSIESLMNIEVAVASKTPQKLSETATAVFVITHEDIGRFGYRTLNDVLRRVTGFHVSNDRTWESIGVRGIFRPGDYNTRLLILVDGHRVNELQFAWAKSDEALPVDIESIERVEIVKGPGSALWGANAELAVINVVTKTGANVNGFRATTDYGSFGLKKGFVEYGQAGVDGLDVSASISGIQSDGEGRIYLAEWANEPDKNGGVAEDSNAREASHGLFSAAYKGVKFLYARGSATRSDVNGDPGFFSSPTGYFRDTRSFTELSYEKDVSPARNGKLLARAFSDENVFECFYFEQEAPVEVAALSRSVLGASNWPPGTKYWRDGARTWGAEVRYSWDAAPGVSVVSGLEYNSFYKPLTLEEGMMKSEYNLASGYLQTDAKLGSASRFIGGVRLDTYSNYDSVWSPRLGFVHNVSPTSSLKLMYGTAYRPPTTWEAYYAVEGLGLPAVRPENMVTYELTWDQQIKRQTRLVTSLFVNDLRDMIDGDIYMNIGRVISQGIEVQMDTRLPGGLVGYGGFSALRSWNKTTGRALDNAPRFLANGGVSVPALSHKLYLSAEAQYVGGRSTENLGGFRGFLPGYVVTNLVLSNARAARSNLDLSLRVYNLFNHRYYEPMSSDTPPLTVTRVPQVGRTVQLQFNYHYF